MKLLKKLAATAIALALVSGAMGVNEKAEAFPGTPPETSKELKIKKVLNLPDGVNTPAETFAFTFTKHSVNNDEGKKETAPNIDPVTIAYTIDDKTDSEVGTDGKQVSMITDNVLKNVTFDDDGQYTYTVTETLGNTPGMTYSKASYLVSIFVGKSKDNKHIVKNIYINTLKDDKGVDKGTEKVEYDPTGDNNGFKFENYYDKEGELELKKTVKGDPVNTNQDFEFTINITKPVGGSDSAEDIFTYTIGTQEKKAKYGEPLIIQLKHDEKVGIKLLVGSTVKVEETNSKGYTPEINTNSLINGTKVTIDQLKNGVLIGDNDNNAIEFINTQQTPTGILVDNLPFIALVLVAGTGIFFFVKNRKEEEALA